MAKEIFNADAAVQHLKSAIQSNNDLADKFRSANEKVNAAFTTNGDAVSGKLGDIASTVWGDNSGNKFNELAKATEDFLQDKVPDIIAQMSSYQEQAQTKYQQSSTDATYGG